MFLIQNNNQNIVARRPQIRSISSCSQFARPGFSTLRCRTITTAASRTFTFPLLRTSSVAHKNRKLINIININHINNNNNFNEQNHHQSFFSALSDTNSTPLGARTLHIATTPSHRLTSMAFANTNTAPNFSLTKRRFASADEDEDDSGGGGGSEWAELEKTIKNSGRVTNKKQTEEERNAAIYEEFSNYQNHLFVNRPESVMVSSALRERMWSLHVSDPKVYTVYRLASQFKLEPNRVMAILYLRQKEKENELLSGKNASMSLQLEYEKRFPTTSDPDFYKPGDLMRNHLIPGMHWQAVEDEIDEGLHLQKIWGYNDRLPIWLRKKEFDPTIPPPEFAGPPKVYQQPTRSAKEVEGERERRRIPKGGGRVIVVDTSKFNRDFSDLSKPERHQTDWNRMILIQEMDGMIRDASWEERGKILFSRKAHQWRDYQRSAPDVVKWDEKFYKFMKPRYKLSKEDERKDFERQMRFNKENVKAQSSRARAGGVQNQRRIGKRHW